jgi:hypothetical protein
MTQKEPSGMPEPLLVVDETAMSEHTDLGAALMAPPTSAVDLPAAASMELA